MAVVATFGNAMALAEEIEAKAAVEQAMKEGRLPSFLEEMYAASQAIGRVVDTVQDVAKTVDGTVDAVAAVVDAVEDVVAVVVTVPSLVVPAVPVVPKV
jgi:ABC-type transporter Mla subunit MlaD